MHHQYLSFITFWSLLCTFENTQNKKWKNIFLLFFSKNKFISTSTFSCNFSLSVYLAFFRYTKLLLKRSQLLSPRIIVQLVMQNLFSEKGKYIAMCHDRNITGKFLDWSIKRITECTCRKVANASSWVSSENSAAQVSTYPWLLLCLSASSITESRYKNLCQIFLIFANLNSISVSLIAYRKRKKKLINYTFNW